MPRPRKSPLRSIPVLDLAAELRSRQSELPALMNRYVEIVEELDRVESMITALGVTFDPKHPPLHRRGPGRPAKASAAMGGRKARGGRAKNDGSLSDALPKV